MNEGIKLTPEDLLEIRTMLQGYNHALMTQTFPKGMEQNLRHGIENFLVMKSKRADALIAKIYDILNPPLKTL